jgi:integrase
MASIKERDGKFHVRVRRQGYACAAKTFTRRSDGLAWARRVEADMESGRWVDPARQVPTLTAAIAAYEAAVASKLKGWETYKGRLRELGAAPFSGKPVCDVTPFDIARWRDEQSQGRKPATVVRKLALLSAVMSWCIRERGWATENPLARVSKPRVADGRDRTLSTVEVGHLLSAAQTSKATWLAPALTVLLSAAMRRGELFALTLPDLDFERATAHLPDTKNGTARDVPLCPRSVAALRQLAVAAQQRGDVRLLPIGAQRAYRAACEADGRTPDADFLADLRLHDLRHHAVTAWASTGALSLPELMAISGHRSTRMFVRYSHLSAQAISAKLAGLSPSSLPPTPAAPPPPPISAPTPEVPA